MRFFSQVGQDRYLFNRYFKGKRDGVFVDVGAYDGETYSNTLFLERYLGWSGLCIEPLPSAYEKLVSTRRSKCINCAVSDFDGDADFLEVDVERDEKMLSGLIADYDPRHIKRIEKVERQRSVIQVPVRTLKSILAEQRIEHVDYCSIDTEGSEHKIIEGFDFDRFDVSIISIENNYRDPSIAALMADAGYDLATVFEGYDDLYVKRDVKPLPQTTVICAVWHADANRAALLREHMHNLDRQTRPINRVYVFDGNDAPPSWLTGSTISVRHDLTIYEAWNLALAAVSTPYVMNLNLDDRLAVDAIECLEDAMVDKKADLVGGDWRICHSQAETDAVGRCQPVDGVPVAPKWPPTPGLRSRLGSGTGERTIYGPACLWRMTNHIQFPRYPWRTSDGTPIRVSADLVWWKILVSNGRKRLVRLPLLIGNYSSHPASQAEFRSPLDEETARIAELGCSYL